MTGGTHTGILSAHVRGVTRVVSSTASEDRRRVKARSTPDTAGTPRASRSNGTASRRSCSIWAPVSPRTATSSADTRVPRHGAADAPALGSRAGSAVLRTGAQAEHHARRPRAAPARRRLQRRVRATDVPAVLPDPSRRSDRRRPLPRHRRRRLPGRAREGAVTLRSSCRAHARLPGRVGRAVGCVRSRPRTRLLS